MLCSANTNWQTLWTRRLSSSAPSAAAAAPKRHIQSGGKSRRRVSHKSCFRAAIQQILIRSRFPSPFRSHKLRLLVLHLRLRCALPPDQLALRRTSSSLPLLRHRFCRKECRRLRRFIFSSKRQMNRLILSGLTWAHWIQTLQSLLHWPTKTAFLLLLFLLCQRSIHLHPFTHKQNS